MQLLLLKWGKMFFLPVEALSFYKSRLEENYKSWEPDWEKKAVTLFLCLQKACCSTEI